MQIYRFLLTVLIAQSAITGTVERVVDGDTIKVWIGNALETVRYIGIDTPETVHPNRGVEPYGKAASEFNRGLVEGRQVRLEFDVEQRDRYGRLLAYVYVDTVFVNAEMIHQGFAQLMTVPPNVKHVDQFISLQGIARETNRGLWSLESSDDEQKPAIQSNEDIIVYITKTGSKYHSSGCHHLSKSMIAIQLSEAIKRYEACRVCSPPSGDRVPPGNWCMDPMLRVNQRRSS